MSFLVFFLLYFYELQFCTSFTAFNISLFFGGLIRLNTQTAKRESGFYFAKGYCKIITPKQNIFDQMKFLFLALDSYNKYLGRNTKYQIRSISRIYSKFLSFSPIEKDGIITLVRGSLNTDHFELANYLSLFSDVPETEFFYKGINIAKIKTSWYFSCSNNSFNNFIDSIYLWIRKIDYAKLVAFILFYLH